MGPSCGRNTRKSSSRRRTLFKKPKDDRDHDSPEVDASKDVINVEISYDTLSECSTPRGEKFRIPEVTTCPPPPKKRRTCSLRRSPIPFFASPDIELFFYLALRGIPV